MFFCLFVPESLPPFETQIDNKQITMKNKQLLTVMLLLFAAEGSLLAQTAAVN